MKVLYVAKVGEGLGGVNKKIEDTISIWRKMNIDVKSYNSAITNNRGRVSIKKRLLHYFYDLDLKKQIDSFEPDIIYWRYGPVPLLQKFNSRTKIIVESNTNLQVERKNRGFVQQLFIEAYRLKFNYICSGIVGVTPESLNGFDKIRSKTVIGNGIRFNDTDFDTAIKSKEKNQEVTAVFLGSPGCAWHGLDKILEAAKMLPKINFKIIGYTKSDLLEFNNTIPQNIHFKGYLEGDGLYNELTKSHFAIGSLAMQRAGMQYSSSLKNRAYLQYGLPILMQGQDINLSQCPGVLSMPMNFTINDIVSNINILQSFSYTLKDKETIKRCIDSTLIEKSRVGFFTSLINNQRIR